MAPPEENFRQKLKNWCDSEFKAQPVAARKPVYSAEKCTHFNETEKQANPSPQFLASVTLPDQRMYVSSEPQGRKKQAEEDAARVAWEAINSPPQTSASAGAAAPAAGDHQQAAGNRETAAAGIGEQLGTTGAAAPAAAPATVSAAALATAPATAPANAPAIAPAAAPAAAPASAEAAGEKSREERLQGLAKDLRFFFSDDGAKEVLLLRPHLHHAFSAGLPRGQLPVVALSSLHQKLNRSCAALDPSCDILPPLAASVVLEAARLIAVNSDSSVVCTVQEHAVGGHSGAGAGAGVSVLGGAPARTGIRNIKGTSEGRSTRDPGLQTCSSSEGTGADAAASVEKVQCNSTVPHAHAWVERASPFSAATQEHVLASLAHVVDPTLHSFQAVVLPCPRGGATPPSPQHQEIKLAGAGAGLAPGERESVLDCIARQGLGLRCGAASLIATRVLTKQQPKIRLFSPLPLSTNTSQGATDGATDPLAPGRPPSSLGGLSLNLVASWLAGHPVYGPAVAAAAETSWSQEGMIRVEDVTLMDVAKLLLSRSPAGAYALSCNAPFLATLPSHYPPSRSKDRDRASGWPGKLPKVLLLELCQPHRPNAFNPLACREPRFADVTADVIAEQTGARPMAGGGVPVGSPDEGAVAGADAGGGAVEPGMMAEGKKGRKRASKRAGSGSEQPTEPPPKEPGSLGEAGQEVGEEGAEQAPGRGMSSSAGQLPAGERAGEPEGGQRPFGFFQFRVEVSLLGAAGVAGAAGAAGKAVAAAPVVGRSSQPYRSKADAENSVCLEALHSLQERFEEQARLLGLPPSVPLWDPAPVGSTGGPAGTPPKPTQPSTGLLPGWVASSFGAVWSALTGTPPKGGWGRPPRGGGEGGELSPLRKKLRLEGPASLSGPAAEDVAIPSVPGPGKGPTDAASQEAVEVCDGAIVTVSYQIRPDNAAARSAAEKLGSNASIPTPSQAPQLSPVRGAASSLFRLGKLLSSSSPGRAESLCPSVSASDTAEASEKGHRSPLEACDRVTFRVGMEVVAPEVESALLTRQPGDNLTVRFPLKPLIYGQEGSTIPAGEVALASKKEGFSPGKRGRPFNSPVAGVQQGPMVVCHVAVLGVEPPEEEEARLEVAVFTPSLSRQRNAHALQLIRAKQPRTLVDLGCGRGSLLAEVLSASLGGGGEAATNQGPAGESGSLKLSTLVGMDIIEKDLEGAAKALLKVLKLKSTSGWEVAKRHPQGGMEQHVSSIEHQVEGALDPGVGSPLESAPFNMTAEQDQQRRTSSGSWEEKPFWGDERGTEAGSGAGAGARAGAGVGPGIASIWCPLQRVLLLQGSVAEFDPRLLHPDMVTCVEVVEHLDEGPLAHFGPMVLGCMRPKHLLVSTPNFEYNPVIKQHTMEVTGMKPTSASDLGAFRNSDHRFEWTRLQFEAWARQLAETFSYAVEFTGVGELKGGEGLGFASQVAVFERRDGAISQVPSLHTAQYKLVWDCKLPL